MLSVTPLSENTQVVHDTEALQAQLDHLQAEEASGQSYTEPDQAPAIVAESMTLSSDLANTTWDQDNLTTATNVLTTTTGALQSMVTLVNQAEALSIQASDPANHLSGDLTAQAATAQGYVDQFIGLLETQAHGVSVFAGQDPFQSVVTGTALTNVPAAGSTAWAWSLPINAYASVTVTANGYEPGIAPGSTSVFENTLHALQGLVRAMHTNTASTAESALTSVSAQLNTLTAYMGAQQQNVTTYTAQAETEATTLKSTLATTDGVNLTQVLSDAAADTTAYQAALQGTDALLQLSLWKDLNFS